MSSSVAAVVPQSGVSAAPTDEELMLAHASGDRHAFATLFRRHAGRLEAFFRRHAPRGTADDLVQLTFLRLHDARASYRPELPLRPFLYAIAVRVRIDEGRRRARRLPSASGSVSDAQGTSTSTTPESDLVARQLGARARVAIDALPETQRAVVLLHRFEDMSFAEIAQTLSMVEGTALTEGAARIRAFRAYDALRRALAETDGGAP